MLDRIYDWWTDQDPASFFVVVILFLLLAFIAALFLQPYEPLEISGRLVGKEYTPAETHTGLGTGVGADGKPVTVVTTSRESEKWTMILLVGEKYETYDVGPATYYSAEVGQDVTLPCARGAWIPITTCRYAKGEASSLSDVGK